MPRLPFVRCAIAALLLLMAGGVVARDPVADYPYEAPGSFVALSYHEVRDDVRDYPDPYAVDSAALVRQFAWLRGNGYTPVSLDQIIAARGGGKALPAKAVLLTFDDAYLSFYTRVYPLLLAFNYPAVLAVVGAWIDDRHDSVLTYGEKGTVVAAQFPTWPQLREMADSGLVELASHSYDLHRGVPANPQGNLQPAATARIYDAASGDYEDDTRWHERVSADLAHSAMVLERETGRRPRVVVWPYGSCNNELLRMAGEWGMTIALTLDDGANTPDVPLTALRRTLIEHNPALAEWVAEVRGPRHPEPVRVVEVNLDDVYDADNTVQERKLSVLLDRIEVLKPTHVYLRATTDADGDGVADGAYFPNRHLPMRGNLFNRAAWQLASRVDVKVFAVMPVTAWRLPQDRIAEVYEDLARYNNFDGLVFDDGLQSGEMQDADTLAFTHRLALRARAARAPLQTARTTTRGQGMAALAAEYDFITLIEDRAVLPPDAVTARKLVYLLHSTPASGNGRRLARRMRELQRGGALNFGYFNDDFMHDNPPLADVAPALSLRVNPLAPAQVKP